MAEGSTIGQAYVQIMPSTKGFKGQLTSAMSPAAESAGKDSGSKLSSGIKKIIAAAGIGKALKDALDQGAALEQSIGGIKTLFQGSSDTVIKNAKNAFKTAGMSANEYMETTTQFAASLLNSLGGNTKKAAADADLAITDMSDNVNKFGTNMEDVQNAYRGFSRGNFTMLDNLSLGFSGTKEGMQQLLDKAEELSGVKYDISSYDDIVNAIHVVQDNMGIAGTTSKEAATTFSGSFASMKAAAENLMGNMALGQDVGPAFDDLQSTTSTFLFDNFLPMVGRLGQSLLDNLPQVIQNLTVKITAAAPGAITALANGISTNLPILIQSGIDIVKTLAQALIDNGPQLLQAGLDAIQQIQSGITQQFGPLGAAAGGIGAAIVGGIGASKITGAVSKLIGASGIGGMIAKFKTAKKSIDEGTGAFKALTSAFNVNPIALVVIAIAALVAGFIYLWHTCKPFRDFWINLWNGIKEIVHNVVGNVSAQWTIMKNKARAVFFAIKAIASSVWNGIKSVITGRVEKIRSKVSAVWDTLKSVTSKVWNRIKTAITTPFNMARDTVKNVVDAIRTKISSVWDGIRSTTSRVWDGIKRAITHPIETARDTIHNLIEKIKGFFHFSISRPHIPLPHFGISPEGWKIGDLLKGSIPHLSISWYAKGGILEGPTLFGAQNGRLLGGGEAGPEAVAPISTLQGYIRDAIDDSASRSVVVNLYSTVNGAENPEDYAERLIQTIRLKAMTI